MQQKCVPWVSLEDISKWLIISGYADSLLKQNFLDEWEDKNHRSKFPFSLGKLEERILVSIYLPIKKIYNWITEMKIKKFANRAS